MNEINKERGDEEKKGDCLNLMVRSKKILFTVILMAFLLLFAILLTILSETILKYKAEQEGVFYNYNNQRIIKLWELVPDSIFKEIILPENKLVHVGTDSEGFLLPASTHENPDITLAFLGGSTTYVVRVRPKDRFPYVVGRSLEKKLGKKVRSLNAAIPGADTSHSINVLVNKVLPQKPDYVVTMHAINDLGKLMIFNGYWNPLSVRYGGIQKKYSFGNSLRYFKNQYFPHTYKAIRPLLNYFSHWNNITQGALGAIKDEWAVHRGKKTILVDELDIKSQFKSSIMSIVRVAESWGATPVLLVQASRVQNLHSDNPSVIRHYEAVTRDWGISREQYHRLNKEFRQIVRNTAKETGALLIDLDKELSPDSGNFHDKDDMVHLNTKGSKAAATLITNILEKKIQECLERTGKVKCFVPARNNR